MTIDRDIHIKTDDGYTIFKAHAEIEYTITREATDVVEVEAFEIIPTRRDPDSPTEIQERATPFRFDGHQDCPWVRRLFFLVKADLEADAHFIHAAIEQEWRENDRYPLLDFFIWRPEATKKEAA